MITYRKAKPEDIYPAFELALRVFMEFETPDYEQDAVVKFKSDCIDNDGLHQRQGIATTLMNNMVCDLKLRGFDKITLNSSPYRLPFYKHFGFKPIDTEQKKDGFIFTPMEYIPNEIWDVLDEKGNKTGRYAERGRKMAAGDYHLVVHVWKHNGKGEWLINKRASAKGTSIDGKWETTGGAALAGDDSLTAALRETKNQQGCVQ